MFFFICLSFYFISILSFQALENIKHVQVEKYHKSDEATKPTIELNPVNIFHQALENAKPLVMTKRIKRGGSTYQVCGFFEDCHQFLFRAQLFKTNDVIS